MWQGVRQIRRRSHPGEGAGGGGGGIAPEANAFCVVNPPKVLGYEYLISIWRGGGGGGGGRTQLPPPPPSPGSATGSFVFLVCVVPRHAVLLHVYLAVLFSFLFTTLGVWKGNEGWSNSVGTGALIIICVPDTRLP